MKRGEEGYYSVHERVILSVLKERPGRHTIQSISRGGNMAWNTAKKHIHTLIQKGKIKQNGKFYILINNKTGEDTMIERYCFYCNNIVSWIVKDKKNK